MYSLPRSIPKLNPTYAEQVWNVICVPTKFIKKDFFIDHVIEKRNTNKDYRLEIWIVLDAISIRGTHDSSPEWNLGEIGQSVSHFLVKPCLDRR